MRICIILPSERPTPSGGFKIVYEYANRMVRDGINVIICYPYHIYIDYNPSIIQKIKDYRRYIKYKPIPFLSRKWFSLDKRIVEKKLYTLPGSSLPKADKYIATAVQTAIALNEYKNIDANKKFYFIQGYENWVVDEKRLIKSFHFPIHKIVVSNWLHNKLLKFGEESDIVLNGFDFNEFKYTTPIEKRDKFTIAMLYHSSEGKGCIDGIIALFLVKQKYPQIKAKFFGVPERPSYLPDWVEYYQTPNNKQLNDIYNSSSIFIGTSHSEGWGLTVGEASICGCAIVCTNTDGYLEMITDQQTGLVVPIKSPEELAKSTINLIENPSLRYTLSKNGRTSINKYSIEESYFHFKNILLK